ncbi:MAG: ABC transporter permease [Acidobacteriota bacterium]
MPEWKQEISKRLANLGLKPEREAEILEELAQHLEEHYQELLVNGMTDDQAYNATLQELNNSELLREELTRIEPPINNESVILAMLEKRTMIADLWRDLRFGLRILGKKPGFTAIAVLTLALGIGASTAIFSAVNTLLLRPLPIKEVDQLVFGLALREGSDPFETSLLDYAAYRGQCQAFTSSGIGQQQFYNLVGKGEPERLQGAAVMVDFLSTLGIPPVLGRSFVAGEDRPGGPDVMLLGYDLWQRRFGGDDNLIGQALNLEGKSYTVIGVMPPGFDFPYAAEVWLPLQINIDALPLEQRARPNYAMIARLKPGVSLLQADTEVKALARQLEQEYPQIRRGWSYKLVGLRQQLMGDITGQIEKALYTLILAVGFLLLICCVNIANLLLVQGVAREREMAIRLALGAGRGRIMRQLLVESLLLAFIGNIVGLLLAYWITPLLGTLSPIQAFSLATFLKDYQIDASVLKFSLLLSLLTGIIFGLIPALKMVGNKDLVTIIKQTEQRSGGAAAGWRWLRVLVVAEIAMAVTLLMGAALMVQSFQRLQKIELGFSPENRLLMQVALSPNKYPESYQRIAFTEQVLQRIKALPGVISAGTTTNVPLQIFTTDSIFTVEGRPPANPADVPITAHRYVSSDYLQTLGVTLIKGRLFNEQDRANSMPVVIVSEELARQAWPGEEPLGKRIRRGRLHQTDFPWLTVVGVVKDIKEDRFNFRMDRPVWYLPYSQQENNQSMNLSLNLLVKTSSDPTTLTTAIRDAIYSVDPDQPISGLITMKDHLADVLITERFSALLMGTLAVISLILAALGLYGVMAYSVSQRIGELGLRMALGARPVDIFKLIIGEAALLIMIGLGIGLMGALVLTWFLSSTLYSVSSTDPVTFISISVLLMCVAILASYIPARRAMKLDPMVILRYE